MKRILTGILILSLGLALFGCAAQGGTLRGKTTVYSPSVAYAHKAWGGVEITESASDHTLSNLTARLEFGSDTEGLRSLISRQTEETILQNTVVTTVTREDGLSGQITGGTDTVRQGNYGVSHSRSGSAIRLPADPTQATVLKEFDLMASAGRNQFGVLKNDVTVSEGGEGTKITSPGKNRSQFGARYLGIEIPRADRYYLSVTVRSEGISGMRCYFSTDTVTLTEDTFLGTLDLTGAKDGLVTLTAEIDHTLWNGTLQTLLFRLPEGEEGSIEISRIALLTLNDPLEEGVFDTLWTVYSDRIYYTQTLRSGTSPYIGASTVFELNGAKCKEITETKNAIGIRLIDGSLLGFVRPLSGGTLRVERGDTVQVILDLDTSPLRSPLSSQIPQATATVRIYLNFEGTDKELEAVALEERQPLTAKDFVLDGAEFVGYDPKGGMYRVSPTEESFTVTVKKNGRTVYLYADPAENTSWCLLDKKGNRLPIFAGTTFPLCSEGKDLTVQLTPQPAEESMETPSFFADSGLIERSRSVTELNGLCAQSTTVYDSPDATYSVTLTSTRLNDGKATIYDVRYDFRDKKQVSDVLESFPFFSFGLTYGFENYFYLNGENETVTVAAGSEAVAYLGSTPYLSLSTDGEAAGWLITDGRMTVGGKPSTALLCLRYAEVTENTPNKMYLSFDLGETEFVRGDILTARIIRWEGDTVDEETLKALRNGGNFQLIQKADKSAGTVQAMGMEETVILQIEGFDRYTFPHLTANGEKFTPEYHVYVDSAGYYGFAFAVAKGTQIEIKK